MAQNQQQQRASRAVAAWMAFHEWNLNQLAATAGVDPGTVGDFLNGVRWPKLGTQGKIEKAIGWPAGTIQEIVGGGQAPPVDGEQHTSPDVDPLRQEILESPRLSDRDKRILLAQYDAMLGDEQHPPPSSSRGRLGA